MASIQHERLDNRRAAFIDAARQLFFEKGYDGTTLADIVERAGGSLATLYKLFGNKEGLLDDVLQGSRLIGEETINAIGRRNLPPAETLHLIATELSEVMLAPVNISVLRIIIGRSVCDPEFARSFYDLSQMRTRLALREVFAGWERQGVKFSGPVDLMSDLFLSLIIFDYQIQALSHGHLEPPSPELLHERTQFFLRGAGLHG